MNQIVAHQLLHESLCVGRARPSAMLTACRSRVPTTLAHVSGAMLFSACAFIFLRKKIMHNHEHHWSNQRPEHDKTQPGEMLASVCAHAQALADTNSHATSLLAELAT